MLQDRPVPSQEAVTNHSRFSRRWIHVKPGDPAPTHSQGLLQNAHSHGDAIDNDTHAHGRGQLAPSPFRVAEHRLSMLGATHGMANQTHFRMTLAAKQDSLIEDLNFLPDPQERLAEIVRRGSRHALPDTVKTPDRRVPGCVSGVWVERTETNGLFQFRCDADSPMVKGLAALLCDLYSGATPEDIAAEEPRVWEACGLHKMLSPTRLNGLRALRERIKQLASE
jgi:cysteine desulfuration protein SufE